MERPYWRLDFQGWVTIAGLLFTSGIFWQQTQQLREGEFALSVRIDTMDERGTRASQRGIYQESEHSKSNELRLAELERQWHEVGPKVERIDVNTQWIMKTLNEHH